jgi:arsenate reductase
MTSSGRKTRVLFLCTHNSARSQMAEGFLRALAGDRFEVDSAGTEATRVHPLAVRAMAEVGIDISGQASKTLDALKHREFNHVVTVCDAAARACPTFPARTAVQSWSVDDPSSAAGDEAARLAVFRRVREEIRARIEGFLRDHESR